DDSVPGTYSKRFRNFSNPSCPSAHRPTGSPVCLQPPERSQLAVARRLKVRTASGSFCLRSSAVEEFRKDELHYRPPTCCRECGGRLQYCSELSALAED